MVDHWRMVCRLALVVALGLLIAGSLLPSRGLPSGSLNDKVLHFAVYAFVGTLAVLAFRQRSARFACLAALTFLGVALEFGQICVPGRSFELWDMAANGCGTFTALTTAWILPPW
jgi:VanZ family protein